jgi:hypothetical protein
MSSTHGNDPHGPLRLNLTEEERESAREVIARLVGEADELGEGVLARVWRAEAEELRRLVSTADRLVDALELRRLEDAPTGAGFPITCESCCGQADGIDENGTARCACCEGGES